MKRVDGLERRLKDEKKTSQSPNNEGSSVADAEKESPDGSDTKPKRPQLDTTIVPDESAVYSPTPTR